MSELKEVKIHIEKDDLSADESDRKKISPLPKHLLRHHHKRRPTIEILEPTTPTSKWNIGCFYLDKECIVYFTQMSILFTCIAVSLWKVATTTENRDFWISLLSSCIGIIIPNPKLRNGPLSGPN